MYSHQSRSDNSKGIFPNSILSTPSYYHHQPRLIFSSKKNYWNFENLPTSWMMFTCRVCVACITIRVVESILIKKLNFWYIRCVHWGSLLSRRGTKQFISPYLLMSTVAQSLTTSITSFCKLDTVPLWHHIFSMLQAWSLQLSHMINYQPIMKISVLDVLNLQSPDGRIKSFYCFIYLRPKKQNILIVGSTNPTLSLQWVG